jgi:ribonucleoside-triphosphate reductase (thioredoxin)
VNVANIIDLNDLEERVEAATVLGTLQAGFTNFHYLRDIWKKTTEKEALIGVGMTGVASLSSSYDLAKLANLVKEVNEKTAGAIGINHAARCTTIKPSGTTSCVLGTSSGIHAWHSKYYLRTVRYNLNEAIANYLKTTVPELCELDVLRPHDTLCVRIPQMAPDNSVLRSEEDTMKFLERIKRYNEQWVKAGHRSGNNTNNVSATVSIKEDEWDRVADWMWSNKESFNGLSIIPYDGGSYVQAPFEEITEAEYERRKALIGDIDLSQIIEVDDFTDVSQEVACAGGACTT